MSYPYANLNNNRKEKMNQSVIVENETLAKIVASAEQTLGRKLEPMEYAVLKYGIEEIRLGLVK